ncbi:DUF2382 domain-containing protein [Actinoplanes sp. CA-030573]|uniref:DUF2382 domain-containing protein n=1 Tax=Actinoplanes sp. CA-030573 TaxID=3239898 RepID=UPI003D8B4DD3
MFTTEQINTLTGRTVRDRDGDKIGEIGQVWEDGTGQPTWMSVKTGLFGLKESLVPLQDAGIRDDDVHVPLEKSQVKDAPNIDVSYDEPLRRDEVERLYRHYGMDWDESNRAYRTGSEHAGTADYAAGDYRRDESAGYRRDESAGYRGDETAGYRGDETAGYRGDETAGTSDTGRTSDRDSGAMTRSEERLDVGTRTEEAGRARLRKYVVTEREQVEVPVRREEVRLEREPITDANDDAAYSGPDITESEHEVTLRAERPVVETETVPVERVRLGKETVTDQETVGGEVRKERIEADLPDEDGRRRVD